jgi:UDP-N-acetylglucosamine:LPS N-acetylglucosamine transferase
VSRRQAEETSLRLLIAGGGTGGHVYPGLAVAEALRDLAPRIDVRFAGTRRGLEAVLVPRAGYPLHVLPASGFRGLNFMARLLFLVNFTAGFLRSLWLIGRWRPGAVLGTGGYVSAPVLAAARVLRRPCALQEQNAIPGSANRLLARWVEMIYLGFAAAQDYFPGRACRVTGNPVRAAFADHGEDATAADPPRADADRRADELRVGIRRQSWRSDPEPGRAGSGGPLAGAAAPRLVDPDGPGGASRGRRSLCRVPAFARSR